LPVSTLYRARYIDLDSLALKLRSLTSASRILEVGCGDGLLTTCLARVFPEAEILAIDIAAQPGRLYRGETTRVRFRSQGVQNLSATDPAPFDLVVVCDVLHHVLPEEQTEFLLVSRRLAGSAGVFVVKEWERRRNLAHCFAWFSDRFITGDRVRFQTIDELHDQARRLFPGEQVRVEGRIGPRPNNVVVSVRAR
jgi:2-polyprenyl-6-hydroxyphenyl methylase/3-demethylubiquinone-9 3-methyltransferase